MNRAKLVLYAFLALVVATGIGYALGGSDRFTIQSALDDARGRLDLAEGRGHLLEARVSLYNVNFGEAGRHFEEAKPPLRRLRERYQRTGKNAAAVTLGTALEHVDEAQRLAAKLDQASNSRASDALEAIRVAVSQ